MIARNDSRPNVPAAAVDDDLVEAARQAGEVGVRDDRAVGLLAEQAGGRIGALRRDEQPAVGQPPD